MHMYLELRARGYENTSHKATDHTHVHNTVYGSQQLAAHQEATNILHTLSDTFLRLEVVACILHVGCGSLPLSMQEVEPPSNTIVQCKLQSTNTEVTQPTQACKPNQQRRGEAQGATPDLLELAKNDETIYREQSIDQEGWGFLLMKN